MRERFGFTFWLGWIFWFAASFVLAALFWTSVLTRSFGKISGAEPALTWSVSVFGSWFILVVPFMRKKEQIWKRLNQDQEKAADAWLLGMGIFIGLLVASALFWSFLLRGRIHAPHTGFDPVWTKAVFGTWLFLLLPFLAVMVRTADRIFKTALARQTQTGPRFRSSFVEKEKRMLPSHLADQLHYVPETLENGHLVTLILKDGRRIPDVFVLNSNEILGIYDRVEIGFEAGDVAALEPLNLGSLPAYEESKWLRLDGRA